MTFGDALPIASGGIPVGAPPQSGIQKDRSAQPTLPTEAIRGQVSRADATHARGRNRVMNAFPPEDADRNLDFDALVAKYEKKIFNVIYRMLGDYEEAADLTQETFFSAYKHYDRFRGDSKVFTWLYQIARNLCINRVRQRERQRSMRIESLDQPRENEDEGLQREIADYSQAPQNLL